MLLRNNLLWPALLSPHSGRVQEPLFNECNVSCMWDTGFLPLNSAADLCMLLFAAQNPEPSSGKAYPAGPTASTTALKTLRGRPGLVWTPCRERPASAPSWPRLASQTPTSECAAGLAGWVGRGRGPVKRLFSHIFIYNLYYIKDHR